jgi:hypothetical protein
MTLFRSLLLLLPFLLLPQLSWGDTLADFRKALSELQMGEQYTPREYLHCVGREEACTRLEGELGNVRITIELNEGTISSLLIVAEEVRIDRELLPPLHALYGTEEKKQEGSRAESIRPDQALRIAAAGYVSYEWRCNGVRIILFSQDPFRIIHDDGRMEVTEPMKTYVNGELIPLN